MLAGVGTEKPEHQLRSLATEHLGLIVSGLLAFIVVYRLLALARWDTQTASAIIQHSGSANVIIGVAVTAAPVFITTALWLLGGQYFFRWARDRKRPTFYWTGFLTVVTVVVGLTVATTFELLFMVIVWIGAGLTGYWDRAADPDLAKRQNIRVVLSVFVSMVVSAVLMSENAWLPQEAITPSDAEPFTAYVLEGTDSSEWVVLRDEPRQIEFIPVSDDRTRSICDSDGGWPGDWFWSRALDLVASETGADYGECPD